MKYSGNNVLSVELSPGAVDDKPGEAAMRAASGCFMTLARPYRS
jgi:hypothetical protein